MNPDAPLLPSERASPDAEMASLDYTQRLVRLQGRWWKRLLGVQLAQRWRLRRLRLGRTLEVGCGIGRNLRALEAGSIGVDLNPHSVAHCRRHGLTAFTERELLASAHAQPGRFDSLLFSHVAEHMLPAQFQALVARYLPLLRPGGRVLCETPQEAGQRSEPSHVTFMDFEQLSEILGRLGISIESLRSSPLPRWFGSHFVHNQFVVIGRRA